MKRIISVAVLALSFGIASGDSITNLSQLVGRELTQEACQKMPVGHDFSNWETATLAVLRSIRMGDVTNFVANATAGMLDREFEVGLTNGIIETFSLAFAQTSGEFSRCRIVSYDITTNTAESACVNINVTLGRGASTNDIPETFNFSFLKVNDAWKINGL